MNSPQSRHTGRGWRVAARIVQTIWSRLHETLVVCVAALLVVGCDEPPDQASQPRPVAWTEASAADGARVRRISGVIQRPERAPVSFEVPGRIERIPVEIGDEFARGDVLAEIDDRPYRLTLSQRRAELAEARSDLRLAEADFARAERLVEQGAVSEAEFDAAESRLESARSRVDTLEAIVSLAEEDLADTRITAPYDGAVAGRLAEPAQQVEPGMPVLEIQSTGEQFEVRVSAPETLVNALERGQEHAVTVPVLDGTEFTGTVREVGADVTNRNAYPVVLRIDGDTGMLRAGMTAEVRFVIDDDADTGGWVAIPVTAYVGSGEDDRGHVFVIDDERSVAVRRDVTLQTLRGEQALVSGELAAGERVVAKGADFVRDGQAVRLLDVGTRRFNP
jgi:RND family efflux transporter MFP subunit